MEKHGKAWERQQKNTGRAVPFFAPPAMMSFLKVGIVSLPWRPLMAIFHVLLTQETKGEN